MRISCVATSAAKGSGDGKQSGFTERSGEQRRTCGLRPNRRRRRSSDKLSRTRATISARRRSASTADFSYKSEGAPAVELESVGARCSRLAALVAATLKNPVELITRYGIVRIAPGAGSTLPRSVCVLFSTLPLDHSVHVRIVGGELAKKAAFPVKCGLLSFLKKLRCSRILACFGHFPDNSGTNSVSRFGATEQGVWTSDRSRIHSCRSLPCQTAKRERSRLRG